MHVIKDSGRAGLPPVRPSDMKASDALFVGAQLAVLGLAAHKLVQLERQVRFCAAERVPCSNSVSAVAWHSCTRSVPAHLNVVYMHTGWPVHTPAQPGATTSGSQLDAPASTNQLLRHTY